MMPRPARLLLLVAVAAAASCEHGDVQRADLVGVWSDWSDGKAKLVLRADCSFEATGFPSEALMFRPELPGGHDGTGRWSITKSKPPRVVLGFMQITGCSTPTYQMDLSIKGTRASRALTLPDDVLVLKRQE